MINVSKMWNIFRRWFGYLIALQASSLQIETTKFHHDYVGHLVTDSVRFYPLQIERFREQSIARYISYGHTWIGICILTIWHSQHSMSVK